MTSPAPYAIDNAPVAPGEIFAGQYRIERVIGEGGMAFVVAARSLKSGELVAIKLLRPELHRYEVMAERFVREALAASHISSEFVPRVFDVGTTESGQAYMVMEHLEGKNLEELLMERLRLPVSEAVDYMLEALEAVAEAHALGIVHRDLKPANIFLAAQEGGPERIKILDFGISKALPRRGSPSESRLLTLPNTVLGSPQYMPPEQALSSDTVDLRADLWSLGVILYELIAGTPPFEGDTPATMFVAIATKPPIPLRLKRPDAPEALFAVILRCLQPDRSKRIQSAAELARALAPFGSERTREVPDRISEVLSRLSFAPASVRVESDPSGAPAGASKASPGGASPAPLASTDPSGGAPRAVAGPAGSSTPNLPEKRRRKKGNVLVFALLAILILGLAMIAQAAWKAAARSLRQERAAPPSQQDKSSVPNK